MDLNGIVAWKIGIKNYQVRSAQMPEGREKQRFESSGNECVRNHPRWRQEFVDPCDFSPVAVPLVPDGWPSIWVKARRQICDLDIVLEFLAG